ncbi:uncharacterized protein LOC127865709 [Dreissena polymorpha]|uniref:uncharacterized protein LOC127865709 n=1 Tax=Dreissena polymorpha TaxID=45954 RepID=UPI002264F9C7|nr:uncharacterized protein LOC127865709 [Dreissena polymorpha]
MSTDSVLKNSGFCNETYAVSNRSIEKTECAADGLNDHNKKLGNETTGVAVQEIPGFYNELYAYWGKPSTTTDHTKKKDYIRKEQSYKTRQIKKELEDCTYGVVNKNTRKHRDHASKDSVSSHADIIEQKNGGLYSMAREPNEKDSAV